MKTNNRLKKAVSGKLGVAAVTAALLAGLPVAAHAAIGQAELFGMGRILGTGGVTAVNGLAGGGINNWALISGLGTNQQIGGTAFYSHVGLSNYNLNAYGASVGLFNRVELSVAHQSFSLGSTGALLDSAIGATLGSVPAPLNFGANYDFKQTIIGLKVRLFGNVVYDQYNWKPQVAIGVTYHDNQNKATLKALGARHHTGETYFLSATKVWVDGLFGLTTLVNYNLNYTNAIQQGLLGFGGVSHNKRKLESAVSAAIFLNRNVAIGGEYRQMPQYQLVAPSNTGGKVGALANAVSKTNNWNDVFVAWFPYKNLSVTAAYVNLGTIASVPNQHGMYVSLTTTF
ncbi:DUF3034 family protein [Acidihalobacter ferrooxydans]|uniref:DUF3034 domain-containing protein n=1 Tax=Acidihalobacter ferrooxydans TaxID=1765967 RepID=A0A1P8UDC7_9GAMM|nr:DUF3034 family protein [Acidihalobacter ferrooxydans]APZ41828.1 hypothetical protein BW247_00895 [Acidihalobacter ferrooxydans]